MGFDEGTAEINSEKGFSERYIISYNELTLVDADAANGLFREDLRDGGRVRRVKLSLLCELVGEGVAASLGIVRRASHRVEQDGTLELLAVWRAVLDPDERWCDHHLTHSLVREAIAATVLLLVGLVRRGLDGTKEVARVEDQASSTNLTEAERRLQDTRL